jgi:hypothetical protein
MGEVSLQSKQLYGEAVKTPRDPAEIKGSFTLRTLCEVDEDVNSKLLQAPLRDRSRVAFKSVWPDQFIG